MFGIVGSEARRHPGRFQVPWKAIMLAAIALIAFAGIYGADWIASRIGENTSAPPPAIQQPVAQPVQQIQIGPAAENPLAQSESEAVAPVTPVVVDYHGVWTEVKGGFDPSTIPVEEGLYSGISSYSLYPGANENQLGPVPPVRYAYAWEILPQLKGLPVAVAADRDEINKDIVLIALDADRYGPSIFLSVDGEKSLCKLDLLPREKRRDAVAVRVVAYGEEIHLYGKDPRPGNHWWEQVATKSELPCS